MRAALGRRVVAVGAHVPMGCQSCQALPPLVVLRDDEPEPPAACRRCGTASTTTVVRLVRVERGPA